MTKPWSEPGDNGGRCESCDLPETVGLEQQACPVKLADGTGGFTWGTLWLCPTCKATRAAREACA